MSVMIAGLTGLFGEERCDECNGHGSIYELDDCPDCDGKGYFKEKPGYLYTKNLEKEQMNKRVGQL